MAMFIKPPLAFQHHHKFNNFLCKTRYCPSFCTLKQSTSVYRKYVSFKNAMETRFVSADVDDKHISHKVFDLHILVNHVSKWVVAVTFGGFVMLRHDALALWAAPGLVSNFILSIALKRILKQERPICKVSIGPGMPSSHAQTIFFTLVFVNMTVIELMELNGATVVLGILLVALGSYFCWLRVLLGYHTTSQVVVGTILGSSFGLLWFWAWEAIVSKAYSSNSLIQIILMIGVVCFYLGFIFYIFWHLIKD